MRIVVALGGNALLPKGEEGTAEGQLEASKKAIKKLGSSYPWKWSSGGESSSSTAWHRGSA